MPHIDRKDFHWFMGVKFALTVYLFKNFDFWIALVAAVAFFVGHRYIIAASLGLRVMNVGDFNTFVTNSKAPTHIMTATPVAVGKPELAGQIFGRIVYAHVKARSCIRKVLGDMYYKELNADDVIKS